MDKKEVEVQNFDGKDYALYDTIMTDTSLYAIFVNLKDNKDVRVFKEVVKDNEHYYETISDDEFDYVMDLYYKQNH